MSVSCLTAHGCHINKSLNLFGFRNPPDTVSNVFKTPLTAFIWSFIFIALFNLYNSLVLSVNWGQKQSWIEYRFSLAQWTGRDRAWTHSSVDLPQKNNRKESRKDLMDYSFQCPTVRGNHTTQSSPEASSLFCPVQNLISPTVRSLLIPNPMQNWQSFIPTHCRDCPAIPSPPYSWTLLYRFP